LASNVAAKVSVVNTNGVIPLSFSVGVVVLVHAMPVMHTTAAHAISRTLRAIVIWGAQY